MKPSEVSTALSILVSAKQPAIVWGAPGIGKCLGRGTPVLMFDGTVKPVEKILAGDKLIGPDSLPRTVISLTHGSGPLYRVTPIKGDPYVVNAHHVLSLRRSYHRNRHGNRKGGSVVNIPLPDYVDKSAQFKHQHKGWRTGVEFAEQPIAIDPYFLGLWLGDGNSNEPAVTTADPEVKEALVAIANAYGLKLRIHAHNNAETIALNTGVRSRTSRNTLLIGLQAYGLINNKHIPRKFLSNSRATRLQVLAGLIDTDGHLCKGATTYEISSKSDRLAADILFLSRSLGFAAYDNPGEKGCQTGARNTYHRITISGDIRTIPVRIARKKAPRRQQKKNVLVTGISVEPLGFGEFFGFELDSDHLFLLGDFTVTHNSQVVQQLGAATSRKVIDLRASLLDPVDLRGIPTVANGRTNWAEPGFLPTKADGPTILLLDELNRAPGMTQNALFQLVLDRKLGEYTLPDICEIIACCNRESDGGGVQKMHLALANRFTHLDMDPDLQDWCKWAVKANIHPMVIAHLRLRPSRLHAMETWIGGQQESDRHKHAGQSCSCGAQMKRATRAFPSPRSWEFVSRMTHQNPQNGIAHALFAGAVGEADAVEYSGTLRLYRELPSVDAILMNPDKATLPQNPAGMYAVSSALVRMTDTKNFGRVLRYMERLSQEYLAFYIQMLVAARPDCQHTPDWVNFHAAHPEVTF